MVITIQSASGVNTQKIKREKVKFPQKATVAADCPSSTRLCRGVNTRGGGLPHFQTVTFTSCPAYKAWNSVSFPKLLHLLGKTERTGRREHYRWPSHRVSWPPSTQISINVAFSQKKKRIQTQNVGWRQGASAQHHDRLQWRSRRELMGGLHDISCLSRHTADVGFSSACFLGGPFSVTSTQVTVRVGGRFPLNLYRYCHKSCSLSPPCRKNVAAAASVRGLPPVTIASTETETHTHSRHQ